jgi:GntR family transcriptional repressor for pyruvate dehydrogenase complex
MTPSVTGRSDELGTVFEAIVAAIMERIENGTLTPGMQLPSERELSMQFTVSRGTLREAIRVLDYAGVLDRRRSGTYVSDEALSKGSRLRAHAALLGQESPLDIMVARRALEPMNARYAALNRHIRDLSMLNRLVREHREVLEAGGDPEQPDRKFHVVVAAASRNPLLHQLFERVADVMQQRMWSELKHRSRDKLGRSELYLQQHEEIVYAIDAGDSPGAESAMAAHLTSVEEGLLAEIE